MKNKRTKLSLALAGVLMVIGFIIILLAQQSTNLLKNLSPEIARSMTYEQAPDDPEEIDNTGIKFDAYFLRDLDGDGYAERLRGSCRAIGEEDTLYIDLKVGSNFKNGKIQINGKNFYLLAAIPKDSEVKENSIGSNVKQIKLNDINASTSRLFMAKVRSGDYTYSSYRFAALDNNKNKYSVQDNEIILTGTYFDGEQDVEVSKTINVTVDWHGTTKTSIPSTWMNKYNLNQNKYDLPDRINDEDQTVSLDFTVYTKEDNNDAVLSKSVLKADIPEINGYAPSKVEAEGVNVNYSYDDETKKLTISKSATTDQNGKVDKKAYDDTYNTYRYSEFKIKLEYPLEAYASLGEEKITLNVPIYAYYEGFNNTNSEFTNPYKSNTARETVVVNYENPRETINSAYVYVGKYLTYPYRRYYVSKEKPLKVYNNVSEDEQEDKYIVTWRAYTGTNGETTGWVLKETKNETAQKYDSFVREDDSEVSLENISTNIGIYFSNPVGMLGEEGWIKVYDEETGYLLETFTKDNWTRYTESNPYKYEEAVKNIRVETSDTNKESSLFIYCVKNLDTKYITENYTKAEFDEFIKVKSNIYAYIGEDDLGARSNTAEYEMPYSIATLSMSTSAISTQYTEEHHTITINAGASDG